MPNCCICGPSNIKGSKISYHKIPVNLIYRRIWLDFIKKCGGDYLNIKPLTYICSKHFTKDSFKDFTRIRCLKEHAIPTIMINHKNPECIQMFNVRSPFENGTNNINNEITSNIAENNDIPKSFPYINILNSNKQSCSSVQLIYYQPTTSFAIMEPTVNMNIAPDVPIVNANSESPRKHFMNSSMSTSIDVNLSQKNKIKTLNKPPNNPEKKIRNLFSTNTKWSKALCLKLIDEYKKHEVLWNWKLLNNKKYAKFNAWRSISKALNINVKLVKEKIYQLRKTFHEQCVNANLGTHAIKKPEWFGYKAMEFLLNIHTTNHINVIDNDSSNVKQSNSFLFPGVKNNNHLQVSSNNIQSSSFLFPDVQTNSHLQVSSNENQSSSSLFPYVKNNSYLPVCLNENQSNSFLFPNVNTNSSHLLVSSNNNQSSSFLLPYVKTNSHLQVSLNVNQPNCFLFPGVKTNSYLPVSLNENQSNSFLFPNVKTNSHLQVSSNENQSNSSLFSYVKNNSYLPVSLNENQSNSFLFPNVKTNNNLQVNSNINQSNSFLLPYVKTNGHLQISSNGFVFPDVNTSSHLQVSSNDNQLNRFILPYFKTNSHLQVSSNNNQSDRFIFPYVKTNSHLQVSSDENQSNSSLFPHDKTNSYFQVSSDDSQSNSSLLVIDEDAYLDSEDAGPSTELGTSETQESLVDNNNSPVQPSDIKIKENDIMDTQSEENTKFNDEKLNSIASNESDHDECITFGLYVGNKIKCYQPNVKSAVLYRIQNVLSYADIGSL